MSVTGNQGPHRARQQAPCGRGLAVLDGPSGRSAVLAHCFFVLSRTFSYFFEMGPLIASSVTSRPLAAAEDVARSLAPARQHTRTPRGSGNPDSPEGAARGMENHTLTRILVVEDDEFMAQALVSMLQTIAETNTASGAELCLQVPSHP